MKEFSQGAVSNGENAERLVPVGSTDYPQTLWRPRAIRLPEILVSPEARPWKDVVVVSNRLPVTLSENNGQIEVKASSGGLVTAMTPILGEGGKWIGWTGTDEKEGLEEALRSTSDKEKHDLFGVTLTPEETDGYYNGYSNEVIWLLFHSLAEKCNFNEHSYWGAYKSVNRKFAEAVEAQSGPDDFVWIQDYHLMLAARELRRMGSGQTLGFFLHIPFPDVDDFANLAKNQREEILEGLLSHDLIGMHIQGYVDNFLKCMNEFLPEAEVEYNGQRAIVNFGKRKTVIGAFPISIDPHEFERLSFESDVRAKANSVTSLWGQETIIDVSRLDPTKGIPEGLRAFARTLDTYPELRGSLILAQLVVPSREKIPEYQRLKDEIEGLVREINGRYPGVPVRHAYKSVGRDELIGGIYRVGGIARIVPKKDGMNLVAFEYSVCGPDDGILILSKYAGAAHVLGDEALLVDPNDEQQYSETIYKAVTMEKPERVARKSSLKETVFRHTVFDWAGEYLTAAADVWRQNGRDANEL